MGIEKVGSDTKLAKSWVLLLAWWFSSSAWCGDILIEHSPTNPDARLPLEAISFQIDHSQYPAFVHVRLSTETNNQHLKIGAATFSAAILAVKPASCLVSHPPGCLPMGDDHLIDMEGTKVHAAVAMYDTSHQLLGLAESLLHLKDKNVDSFVLAEKPWHLSLDSFSQSKPHYFVYGIKDGTRVFNANWTEAWENALTPPQKGALKFFNDLILVRRLAHASYHRLFADENVLFTFFQFQSELTPYLREHVISPESQRVARTWISELKPGRTIPCDRILQMRYLSGQ